jgi:hypothetical protein
VPALRPKIVAAARWGIANEPRIHYGELRPVPFGRRLPLTTDCSGFVTLCYYLAGAPDPNGLGYSGQGWTGTLLDHLPRVAEPRPGDIVVFGAYPGKHCAIALEAGPDPLLASHGMERGPVAIRLSAERAIQRAPVAWLSFEAPARTARDEVGDEHEPAGGGDPGGRDGHERPTAAAHAPDRDREPEGEAAGPLEHVGEVAAAARPAGHGDHPEDDGGGEAEDADGQHDER